MSTPMSKSRSIAFAEEFTQNGGFFVYNASKKEASISLRDMLQVKKSVDCICLDYESEQMLLSVDSRWPIRRSYPERASCVLTACTSLIMEGGMVLLDESKGKLLGLPTMPEMLVIMAFHNQCVSLGDANFKAPQPNSFLMDLSGGEKLAEYGLSNVYLSHVPEEVYLFFIDEAS